MLNNEQVLYKDFLNDYVKKYIKIDRIYYNKIKLSKIENKFDLNKMI